MKFVDIFRQIGNKLFYWCCPNKKPMTKKPGEGQDTKAGTRRNVTGLMSGTSTDGVSACLVEITGNYLD
ncbi:MAG: hypothetical protein GY800_03025, partial [Planctomycetes bacterium]|nr:hypothetical protein [Planctomycetota bacterium]